MSQKAGAGIVLPEPFTQAAFEAALSALRDPALAETMSAAGIRYGRETEPVTGLDAGGGCHRAAGRWSQAAAGGGAAAAEARQPARTMLRSRIIVTTYNRPDALDAVLRALGAAIGQGLRDRSSPTMVRRRTPRSCSKSWRPRLGSRSLTSGRRTVDSALAEIRNRAILASSGSLLHLPGRRLHPPP